MLCYSSPAIWLHHTLPLDDILLLHTYDGPFGLAKIVAPGRPLHTVRLRNYIGQAENAISSAYISPMFLSPQSVSSALRDPRLPPLKPDLDIFRTIAGSCLNLHTLQIFFLAVPPYPQADLCFGEDVADENQDMFGGGDRDGDWRCSDISSQGPAGGYLRIYPENEPLDSTVNLDSQGLSVRSPDTLAASSCPSLSPTLLRPSDFVACRAS